MSARPLTVDQELLLAGLTRSDKAWQELARLPTEEAEGAEEIHTGTGKLSQELTQEKTKC